MNFKWDNVNLSLLINKCINTEKNIELIKTIEKKIIESNKLKYLGIKCINNKEEELIKNIKNFGNINIYNNLINIKYSLILNDNINFIETIFKWINPKNSLEAELS